MQHAADFFVAANHGVNLARLGPVGQVDGIPFQGFIFCFCVLVGHFRSSSQFVDCFLESFFRKAGVLQQLGHFVPPRQDAEQDVFHGHVFVAEFLEQAFGLLQGRRRFVGQVRIAAAHLGVGGYGFIEPRFQGSAVHVQFLQQEAHHVLVGSQNGLHQVTRLNGLLAIAQGNLRRLLDHLLRFDGILVKIHISGLFFSFGNATAYLSNVKPKPCFRLFCPDQA